MWWHGPGTRELIRCKLPSADRLWAKTDVTRNRVARLQPHWQMLSTPHLATAKTMPLVASHIGRHSTLDRHGNDAVRLAHLDGAERDLVPGDLKRVIGVIGERNPRRAGALVLELRKSVEPLSNRAVKRSVPCRLPNSRRPQIAPRGQPGDAAQALAHYERRSPASTSDAIASRRRPGAVLSGARDGNRCTTLVGCREADGFGAARCTVRQICR